MVKDIQGARKRMQIADRPIVHSDFISSNQYDQQELVDYWKNNKHVYVCSSKVGSTVIRVLFMYKLDFPSIYMRQNQLKESQKTHNRTYTKTAQEGEQELRARNILYLVRCPFRRAISSFRYRTASRFGRDKAKYMSRGIDLNAMNPTEYISFIRNEIENHQYNSTIEHSLPQRKSFHVSAFAGTKIRLLWQTEKINELIQIWNQAYGLSLDSSKKLNVTIKRPNELFKPYKEYPGLFDLVKRTFKEDLDWLNPIFDYENKFLKDLQQELS